MARSHLSFTPDFEYIQHIPGRGIYTYIREITICFVAAGGKLYHGMACASYDDVWSRQKGNRIARGRARFSALIGAPKGGVISEMQGIPIDTHDRRKLVEKCRGMAEDLARSKEEEIYRRHVPSIENHYRKLKPKRIEVIFMPARSSGHQKQGER